jgi:hypothetical protein
MNKNNNKKDFPYIGMGKSLKITFIFYNKRRKTPFLAMNCLR